MRVLLSVLVLVAASPAWALVNLTLQSGSQKELEVGADDCDLLVSVNYAAAPGGVSCSDVEIWATRENCGSDVAAGDLPIAMISAQELQLQGSGTVTFRVGDLPAFTSEQSCGTPGQLLTHRICSKHEVDSSQFGSCSTTQVSKGSSPPKVTYDSQPPPPPVILEVTPKDSGLSVRATTTDAVLLRAELRPAASVDEFVAQSGTSSTGVLSISNLQNGIEYEVRVVAEDAAGNVSEPSASVLGTPVQTIGFFGSYCRAGGDCEGGCGAAAGAPTLLGLLAAAFALSRRKS